MNTHADLQSVESARQEWLQARKLGIGGSDVAAILGLSKYKSPYQLWLDKTSRAEVEEQQSEAAYWGNTLEDIVAKEFQKRAGVKVQKVNQTLVHTEFDWARANIDRAVINPSISGNVRFKEGKLTTDQILECKTANQYLAKLWGDDNESVPDYYLTQCQWYMGISQTEKCSLAVLIGGQKFRFYEIQFDAELFQMLLDECGSFWNEHVLADVPPAPTTFDDVLNRWSKHNPDQAVTADSELLEAVQEYKSLNGDIKAAQEELDQLKIKICSSMQDAEMIIDQEKRIATFKYQESNRLDSKALKAAHPEIYEQFVKTSSTRVLRIN